MSAPPLQSSGADAASGRAGPGPGDGRAPKGKGSTSVPGPGPRTLQAVPPPVLSEAEHAVVFIARWNALAAARDKANCTRDPLCRHDHGGDAA